MFKYKLQHGNAISTRELVNLLINHKVIQINESMFTSCRLTTAEAVTIQPFQQFYMGFADNKVLSIDVYNGTHVSVYLFDRTFSTFECGTEKIDLEHNERAVTEYEIEEVFDGIAAAEKWIKNEVTLS